MQRENIDIYMAPKCPKEVCVEEHHFGKVLVQTIVLGCSWYGSAPEHLCNFTMLLRLELTAAPSWTARMGRP